MKQKTESVADTFAARVEAKRRDRQTTINQVKLIQASAERMGLIIAREDVGTVLRDAIKLLEAQ